MTRRVQTIGGTVLAVAAIALGGFAIATRASVAPDLPTAQVTRGDFVDYLQVRGEIRPAKSIVLTAPMQSGDLQILKLAKNGAPVKAGDVVVEFDATALKQRLQEKQSELKQAEAEIEQMKAQQRIVQQQDAVAVSQASYDVERAKLDVGKRDIISKLDYEAFKLALSDTEQKLREAQEKAVSDKTGAQADIVAKERKRDKAKFDVDRAQQGLEALTIKAPADGIVNIMPNYRSGGMFGGEVEFREGDRIWPGAQIVELPDLSSIHLEARLDETDRGRLKVGLPATVHIEAVPGKDFDASVDLISVLAKIDFSAGWPPPKNFDLGLVLTNPDPRIRPGMTATARIAADRVPGMLLVPADAVFQHDGHPVVYVLHGSAFEERRIAVQRRGSEQVALASGLSAGDKVATVRPAADQVKGVS